MLNNNTTSASSSAAFAASDQTWPQMRRSSFFPLHLIGTAALWRTVVWVRYMHLVPEIVFIF